MGSRTEELNSVRALRLPLEPSPHFACLRDFLRNSDFYEPSICRRVGMTGLSDFLSGDRTRITLSGESDTLGVLIRLFLLGEFAGGQGPGVRTPGRRGGSNERVRLADSRSDGFRPTPCSPPQPGRGNRGGSAYENVRYRGALSGWGVVHRFGPLDFAAGEPHGVSRRFCFFRHYAQHFAVHCDIAEGAL